MLNTNFHKIKAVWWSKWKMYLTRAEKIRKMMPLAPKLHTAYIQKWKLALLLVSRTAPIITQFMVENPYRATQS